MGCLARTIAKYPETYFHCILLSIFVFFFLSMHRPNYSDRERDLPGYPHSFSIMITKDIHFGNNNNVNAYVNAKCNLIQLGPNSTYSIYIKQREEKKIIFELNDSFNVMSVISIFTHQCSWSIHVRI